MLNQLAQFKTGMVGDGFSSIHTASAKSKQQQMDDEAADESTGKKAEIFLCPMFNDSFVFDLEDQNEATSTINSESDSHISSGESDSQKGNQALVVLSTSHEHHNASVNDGNGNIDGEDIPSSKKHNWTYRAFRRAKKIVKQLFTKQSSEKVLVEKFSLSSSRTKSKSSLKEQSTDKELKFTEHESSSMEDVGLPPLEYFQI